MAERLSTEMGIALVPIRITSGQELVLSFERRKLAHALQQHVAQDPAVQKVSIAAGMNALLPAAEIVFRVDFAAHSAAQEVVRQAAQKRRRTSSEIRRLVARLAAGAYPQPVGQVDTDGQLILTINVEALTRDVVKRLKQRADVVYAQPSYIVRP